MKSQITICLWRENLHPHSPYRFVNLSARDWDVQSDQIAERIMTESGEIPDPREVQVEVEQKIILELFKFPDELRHAKRTKKPHSICIIGGGVAGLTAAYELVIRGHNVTLFESREGLGGRILTHRFADKTYGELGAMRIPEAHGCVDHYVEQFKLEKRRFVSLNNKGYLFLRNQRTRLRHDEEWKQFIGLYDLKKEFDQRVMTTHPHDAHEKMVEDLSNDLTYHYFSQIFQDFKIPKDFEVLEQTSVGQMMRGVPRSRNRVSLRDRAFEYLGRSTSMIWFEGTSFLQYILNELPLKSPDKYELVGGMDVLTETLASQTREARAEKQRVDLKTGTRVTKLRQLEAGVEVSWSENGLDIQDTFDFIICTAPAAATSRITFDPPLPSIKHEALTNLTYASAAKTIIHCTQRFWEKAPDGIFGGGSYTDLPHQQSWYPSDNSRPVGDGLVGFGSTRGKSQPTDWEADDPGRSDEPAVFLAAYMWEANARRFASLSDQGRTDLILDSVKHVHPNIGKYIGNEIDDVVHWAWDEHESPGGGAWAFFAPGEQQRYQSALCDPMFEDRHGQAHVFFAGEHVAILHAWIQSAIQSALSSVIDVLNAV